MDLERQHLQPRSSTRPLVRDVRQPVGSFRGRTEDTTKTHVPKTYEITRVNGSLEFLSYEDKIAYPTDSTEVPVAVFFNDVWSYDISKF